MKLNLKKLVIILGVACAISFGSLVAVILAHAYDLPEIDSLENYEPSIVTVLYYKDGSVMARYSRENRVTIPTEGMPQVVVDAFIAAEDDQFFEHSGINPLTILRAAIKNIQAGRKVQGGSTITQQVAKTFFLSPERSWSRKIKEMFLAFRLEKAFSKDKILNLYLNQIFLGQGAYGVEAAARTYFGKSSSELSIPEAAILAGLPRAPSRDNPIANPRGAKQKQRYVLRRLVETRKITEEDFEEFVDAPVQIANKRFKNRIDAPYAAEHVRRYLMKEYGADSLYEGGLRVFTTIDKTKQLAAQEALDKGLEDVDKRLGLRAPEQSLETVAERDEFFAKQHKEILENHYDYKVLEADGTLSFPVTDEVETPLVKGKIYQAIVKGKISKNQGIEVRVGNRSGIIKKEQYQWAKEANPEEVYSKKIIRDPYRELKVGDMIEVALIDGANENEISFALEQSALVQGALLSYSSEDGGMESIVGGYDFFTTRSEFNRATQALRQIGSTFKPIVYGAGLEAGLTPATIIVDSPIVYSSKDEQTEMERTWKPHNYGARFYGDTRMRLALAFSRNVPTIKITQYLGVQRVIEFARKLGLEAELNEDLSIALGSSALSLEQMMKPWGVFANKGRVLHKHFISRIEDRNGEILEEFEAPEPEEIVSPEINFLITSLLKSVVEIGTAQRVKALGREVAGKTGTTNDYKDALFLGYTPEILTGVWVGFDEDRPIGRNETGGRAAAPIWIDYMKAALKDAPETKFEVPENIVQVTIDADTGDVPSKDTKTRVVEYFVDGNAPGQSMSSEDPLAEHLAINKTLVITGNTRVSKVETTVPGESPDRGDEGGDLLRDEY